MTAPGNQAPSRANSSHAVQTARFDAHEAVDTWEQARAVLMKAFLATQEAIRELRPVTYVVHNDDLLGRRGAPSAMVATGLLSAARTAAVEAARQDLPVNVIAIDDVTDPTAVDRWVMNLSDRDGPTGEIVRLTEGHLGKALP